MDKRTLILALLLPALLAGCDLGRASRSEAPLTPDEFVEIIVAVREAEREVAQEDSAGQRFEERKQEILEHHGTNEAELQRFLAANRENIALLQTVWDTITERLRFVPAGDADVLPDEDGDDEGDEDGPEVESETRTPEPPRGMVPVPPTDRPLPIIR